MEKNSPVNRYGHKGQYTGCQSANINKVGEFTVDLAVPPVLIDQKSGHKRRVKQRYQRVRHRQIDQEVVRECPHPLVGHDNPYHRKVTTGRHHNHHHIHCDKQYLLPHWHRNKHFTWSSFC